MLWPEKNSFKDLIKKKNSCSSKIPLPSPPPPPQHNFFNGPSLRKMIPEDWTSCFVYIYILGICVFYSYPQVKVAKPSVTDEKLNIISLD